MKRSNRLKAIPVFLALSIILLHGITPHSHVYDQSVCPAGEDHHHGTAVEISETGLSLHELPGSEDADCHFTNILFQEDNTIHFFIASGTPQPIFNLPVETELKETPWALSANRPYHSGNSFRAPPAA